MIEGVKPAATSAFLRARKYEQDWGNDPVELEEIQNEIDFEFDKGSCPIVGGNSILA